MIQDVNSPGLDLYCTDPAQHLISAGQGIDDLDRDLSDLSVRRVNEFLRDWVKAMVPSSHPCLPPWLHPAAKCCTPPSRGRCWSGARA